MSLTYEQARRDHEYLWRTYGPASDMTGGYVDQDDLKKLLEKPTKATARDCYVAQVTRWLTVGPEREGGILRNEGWRSDPEVRAIAIRHWAEDAFLAMANGAYG